MSLQTSPPPASARTHPASGKRPWIRWLLLSLGVVALLISTVWGALSTETGTRTVLNLLPGIHVRDTQGTLASDFSAQELIITWGTPDRVVLHNLQWQGLHLRWEPTQRWRFKLFISHLSAQQLRVELPSPPSGRPLPTLHSLSLPFGIDIEHARLAELRAPGLQDTPLTDMSGHAEFNADNGQWHVAHQARARWGQVQLQGQARIGAHAPLQVQGHIEAQHTPAPRTASSSSTPLTSAWQAQLDVDGPLARMPLALQVQAQGQTAHADIAVTPFTPTVIPHLSLRAQDLDLRAFHPQAPRTALSGHISLAIDRNPTAPHLSAQAAWRNTQARPLDDGGLPLSDLEFEAISDPHHPAQGHLKTLHLTVADAKGAQGQLKSHGHWRLEPSTDPQRPLTLSAELDSTLERIQTQAISRRAPALSLSGPLHLSTQSLPLTRAAWHSALGEIKARAQWEGEWLPSSGTDTPSRTRSRNTPARPKPQAPAPKQPFEWQAQIQAQVDADPDHLWALRRLHVTEGQLRAAAGTAQFSTQLQRAPQPDRWQWQSDLQLQGFDPRVLGMRDPQQREHTLNAQAHWDVSLPTQWPAEHSLHNWLRHFARWQGQADIHLDNSRLYGVPLKGELRLATHPQGRWLTQAQLNAAGNEAQLNVSLSARQDNPLESGTLKIQAPNLTPLSPLLPPDWVENEPLRGDIQAQMGFEGPWPDVRLQGQAQVRDLRWSHFSLARAQGHWKAGSLLDAEMAVQWQAQDMHIGAEQLKTLSLQGHGTTGAHRFSMRAERATRTPLKPTPNPPTWMQALLLQAEMEGGLSWSSTQAAQAPTGHGPSALRWQGQVPHLMIAPLPDHPAVQPHPWLVLSRTALEFSHGPHGPALAVNPTPVELFGTASRLETLRWQAPPNAPPQFDLNLQFPSLPIAPLLARAQPHFGWNGDLIASAQLRMQKTPEHNLFDFKINRDRGDLTVAETGNSAHGLGLSQLHVAVHNQDGHWQATQVIQGHQLGSIEGKQSLQADPKALIPGPDAALQGHLKLQIADLGNLGSWLPIGSVGAGWRLGGSIQSELGLDGQLGDPRYTGKLQGQGLSVRNSLAGVQLREGRIDLQMTGDDAHIHAFEFKSGGGQLKITGHSTLGAKPQAQLHAQANRFSVLQRVDRRISITGETHLTLTPVLTQIEGNLHVDEGLFDFSRGDAPSLGDDVDLINSNTPTSPADQHPNSSETQNQTFKRETRLNLNVNAGEHLRLKWRGRETRLDTRLAGEIKLSTDPARRLQTHGTIHTEEGTFSALGQVLTLERGQLAFTGAIDNPRLDIEAMRPPPPGSDDTSVKVGVAITGTALEPQVRLTSEPEMSETDKLSWLVLGRSSDGLSRDNSAVLARAASALWTKDSDAPNLPQTFGLDELSVGKGKSANGNHTDEARDTIFKIGKQLSRRWYWAYERSLNATSGTWQILYHAANQFTVRAQWQQGEERALDIIRTWRWE